MIRPPDYVLDISPYIPGKPVEELERELGIRDSIKLASNENPAGPSPRALEVIRNSLSSLNRYPDGSGYYLKQAIAAKLSVDEEEIILGNGSNELLDLAAKTFLKDGDEAVMAVPSFVVYASAARSVGAKPVQVPLRNHTHDLEAMARAVGRQTRMLFIGNPNNPTGTINRKEEFDGMMRSVPDDVLVVLDEAYYEYVSAADYADSMKYLRSGKSVLILRTFSKIYGLAGLRIGYGIAKREIISAMNRLREPFNTNTLAQKAALAALSDEGHVRRSREINESGKAFLCRELDSLGMTYVPTEANFVYMPVDDSAALYGELLRMGVIIRPMGPQAVRVTIGLPEENERFVGALKEILGR